MLSSPVSQNYLAKVCLSQCISVWNFYSMLPSLLKRRSCITLSWKVLKENRSKGSQKRPILRGKKTSRRKLLVFCSFFFFFLIVLRYWTWGEGFFLFCCARFVFWQVARYNREKQLHQKYQRDCFQVNWKSYKSHGLFNLCDTAAQDALVVAQDPGQRSEKSGMVQPKRAVGNYTWSC